MENSIEFQKLQEIVADVLNLDTDEVTPECTFAEDLGADSLDLYEIMTNVSAEFEITVDIEAAQKIVTVQDAYDLLQSTIGADRTK